MRQNEIPIPSPCDEPFADMRALGRGPARLCATCATPVHDLSALSDDEARRWVAQHRAASPCVRYAIGDDGEILHRGAPRPDVPPSRLTRAAAALGAVAVLGGAACGGPPEAVGKIGPSIVVPERPKRVMVTREATRLELTAGSGVLVDTNAPPPLPGQPVPTHPFVGGSCGGDAAGCSEARTLLDASTSFEDFLGRLEQAGFRVVEAP